MGHDPLPPQATGSKAAAPAQGPSTVKAQDRESAINLITFQPSPEPATQPHLGRDTFEGAFLAQDKRRKARAWFHRWSLLIGVLAALGVVLCFGPHAYHGYKLWRATQFALLGEESMRKNQIEDAVPIIRSAYILSPRTPEVLRAMAQLLTAFRSPEATNYWNWLLQTRDATDDDRRAAIDCAMQYGLYDQAWNMIKGLLAHHGGDSRNQLLAARWSAARGTPPQTMAYATRAVNDDPNNKTALLFLDAQELSNPYLHQEAVNSLLSIAGSGDELGLQALRQAALDPNLKPDDIDRVIAQLQSHPMAGEVERIAALNLEIKRHPEQRKSLIDQAVAGHQNINPDDLAKFCEWLVNNNEAPRVLKLISRERALSNKSLCFAYLDCLAKLNRWDDIKNLLSGTSVPLEIPLIELYLSRCASETGDQETSDFHWQNAVSAAAYNPTQSYQLAVYAENHGQNDRAAAVYRALTQEPVTARLGYEGLLRVLSDQDTRTLRDLLDEIVSRWPNDPVMACKDVFLNLLLNARVPEMHQRAVSLLANDSNNLSLRTNLALACLRLNDPAGALEAYHNAVIDWNTVPPNDLVVYAATLNANGHGRAAGRLLLLVNCHLLRPELRELIKPIP